MRQSSLASSHVGSLGHALGALAPALIPVFVLIVGLDAFCLVNLARSKSVRSAPKLAWVIVILAVSAPLGALLYLFFGMDRSGRGDGSGSAGAAVRSAAPPAVRPVTTCGTPPGGRLIVTTSGLTKDYGGNGLFGVDLAVPLGYESKIFAHVGNGVRISAPPPTAADGMNSYVSEVLLVGLILVVVLGAGALTFDASQGRAIFLRTRVASSWQLIAPRVAVMAVAAAVAYLLGTLAAWYETTLLIGSLPATRVLAGVVCGAVYLAFGVAVTAFAASRARSTIATAGIGFMILLALPVLGTVHAIARWLPSALVNAPVDVVSGTHQLGYFWPAFAVTAAARWLRAREI